MITILIFILILTVLVLIHEGGHFLVAKFFNIKVEEFGIGFPPRAWGKKIGETIYSINWLPIGGFVKLYGEDEAGGGKIKFKVQSSPARNASASVAGGKFKNSSRAFFAKPWWQRGLVSVAGVVMNFILAVVLISFLFAVVGVPVPGNKVIITQVLKNSPAEVSGLKTGDIVEYINNVKITSSKELIDLTKKHLGEKLVLKVLTAGKEKSVEVTPRIDYPKDQGPMGVAISQNFEVKKYSWLEASVVGTKEALKTSWLMISAFGTVISQIFTQGTVPKDVAGPVGIAQLTGSVCSSFVPCVYFISMLSLNLAILNVLPIPALDGGRLFFILIEGITRRKVHPKFESYVHMIGMVVLLAFLVFVTLHDIVRIISGQPIIPK